MDYETVLLESEERMEKALKVLADKFRGMRTGRASPGLVEELRVEYYGSPTPLKQIAAISAPEVDQLVIKPYDVSGIGDIEKAILKSDIGVTPSNDGKIVRLQIPPLSQERRQKLVSWAKEVSEEARVSLRNIRRDANKSADTLKKDGDLSEDELKSLKDDVQELLKKFEKQVDDSLAKKSEDLTSM